MDYYERVEELRNYEGLSLRALEQKLGFANGTISKWKNCTPSLERIVAVAEYFNVSIDYFVYGKDARVLRREPEFKTSELERNIIRAFRISNPITQENILKLLDVAIETKKSDAV